MVYNNMVIADQYKIKSVIRSQYGITRCLGEDLFEERLVIIKLIDRSVLTKYDVDKICFSNEYQTFKNFDHENIMPVLYAGDCDGGFCFVTKYFENGVVLEKLFDDGIFFSVSDTLNYISQLAQAVGYAHERGIIHKNIKPASILMLKTDDGYVPKLYDFGISYIVDYAASTRGKINENFGYLAPEATGLLDRKVNASSDLYSLGVIMYQMLTGNLPFSSDSIDNMIYQHVAVMPKDPHEFNDKIPEEISAIVLKLLSKDPDLRYQTANELIEDIKDHIEGRVKATTNSEYLALLNSRAYYSGRTKELKSMVDIFESIPETGGRICMITGEHGAGKSSLVGNFIKKISGEGVNILNGRFSKQNADSAYSAFRDILGAYKTIYEQYDQRRKFKERSRIIKLLSGQSGVVYRINPEMKDVLLDESVLEEFDSYRDQQRTKSVLSSLFLNLFPKDEVCVLCFNDIQYASPLSIALLSELAKDIKNHSIFLLITCTVSKDDTEESNYNELNRSLASNGVEYEHIVLKPFTESGMASYIASLLDLSKNKCRSLAAYIMSKTGGNPYYTINILRSLLEEETLLIKDGVITENWSAMAGSIGDDLHQILIDRLKKLPMESIKVIETAAAIGIDFDLDLLSKACEEPEESVAEIINDAVSLQFVEPTASGTYSFTHEQIHDVLLDRIDKTTKQGIHTKVAEAIKALHDPLSNHDIYQLVYHYTIAENNDELLKYIFRCAELLMFSNAYEDSISYYEKGIELTLSHEPVDYKSLSVAKRALIELYMAIGEYEKSTSLADELLKNIHDKQERASLLCSLALGYFRQDREKECEETLRKALSELGKSFPQNLGMTKIKTLMLEFRYRAFVEKFHPITEYGALPEISEEAKLYGRLYSLLASNFKYENAVRFNYTVVYYLNYAIKNFGKSNELAGAFSKYAIYLMRTGSFARSEEYLRTAISICKELGDTIGEGDNYRLLGQHFFLMGQLKNSIKMYDEAIAAYEKTGDVWETTSVIKEKARSKYYLGEYKESIDLAKGVLSAARSMNNLFIVSDMLLLLFRCYVEMGDVEKAEEYSRLCTDEAKESESNYIRCLYRINIGRYLCKKGEYEKAEALLTEGVKIYEENHLPSDALGNIYSILAQARFAEYAEKRSGLSKKEMQKQLNPILSLAKKGYRECSQWVNKRVLAEGILGMILTEGGVAKLGDRYMKDAIEDSNKSELRFLHARVHFGYSKYLLDDHMIDEGRYHLFEAYMTFQSIGAVEYVKLCESIIKERFRDDLGDNVLLATISARQNRLNIDRKINTLLKLGERLSSTLEVKELQNKILQDAVELVGAERGILFLYPETGEKKLYVASIYNLGTLDFNTYDWMLDDVIASGQPIVINDLQSEEYRKHYGVMARYGIKSVMAMPMFVRGKLFGIIYLDTRLTRGIFNEDYMETLGFIANQAGAPIENARLYHRAITDGLTEVYGRSYLDNFLIDKLTGGGASPKLSALMIDIDFFKKCNDTYGHPFGDKVLRNVSATLKRITDTSGIVCRYGGEEFVVVLNTNDKSAVLEKAERIRSTIASSSTDYNDALEVKPVSVTVSIGAAIWTDDMERVELIEHADKALYYAKEHGRNQVKLYDKELG